MKFKKIAAIFALSASSYASAGCVGTVVNGQCLGGYIDNPYVGQKSQPNSSSNAAYQGSSGTRYQYDMANPTDRTRYSTDLDAQRRDQMNLNPNRQLDQGLGKRGGGINND